jgi:hypothetical protein
MDTNMLDMYMAMASVTINIIIMLALVLVPRKFTSISNIYNIEIGS